MRTRTKTAAIALTGAVALASGAYALGTQAGDGAAAAADPARPSLPDIRAHIRGGGPFGLDNLADRLGVDESDLQDALDGVRSQLPDPKDVRGNFAEDLAKELGIDAQEVEDALDRVNDKARQEAERRRDDFAEELADRLKLDADEVKEALGDFPFFGHLRPAAPRSP